jgi:hypothetical protein
VSKNGNLDQVLLQKRKEWKAAKLLQFKLTFEHAKLEKIYAHFQLCYNLFSSVKSSIRLDTSKLSPTTSYKYLRLFSFFLIDGNFSDSVLNVQTQMKELKELVSLTLTQSQSLLKVSTDFKDLIENRDENDSSQIQNQPISLFQDGRQVDTGIADEISVFKKLGSLDAVMAFRKAIQKI